MSFKEYFLSLAIVVSVICSVIFFSNDVKSDTQLVPVTIYVTGAGSNCSGVSVTLYDKDVPVATLSPNGCTFTGTVDPGVYDAVVCQTDLHGTTSVKIDSDTPGNEFYLEVQAGQCSLGN